MRPLRNRLFSILLIVAVALALAACGYGFKQQGSDALPDNVRVLHIVKVDNPTTETWLGPGVRNRLRDELTRRGWTKWGDRNSADGLVTITINQFTRSSSVQDEREESSKFVSSVSLDATIKDRQTGNVVWQSGEVSWSGSYYGNDESAENAADAYAVDNAVRRLADLLSQGY